MIIKKDMREPSIGSSKKEGAPDFNKLEIMSAEKLLGAGRLFSIITLPVGAQVPEHEHHDEYEIYCLLSGEGDYNDNGNIVRVFAGDVMLCSDGELHGLVNNGETELSFIAFVGFANPERQ